MGRHGRSPARSTCSSRTAAACSSTADSSRAPRTSACSTGMTCPSTSARLDAVVLTHAHIDHSGLLPRLVASGYEGRIFCTPGTLDLCRLVLPDAGRIQEEDARQANKHGYTRHAAGQAALHRSRRVPRRHAAPACRLRPADRDRARPVGRLHSRRPPARIGVRAHATAGPPGPTVLFGGDLGRYDRPILPDPRPVDRADVLLLESTYGNRVHPADDDGEALAEVIRATVGRRGSSSSRRSRLAGSRRSSTGSSGSRRPAAFR